MAVVEVPAAVAPTMAMVSVGVGTPMAAVEAAASVAI
jgi:hypothetical protein